MKDIASAKVMIFMGDSGFTCHLSHIATSLTLRLIIEVTSRWFSFPWLSLIFQIGFFQQHWLGLQIGRGRSFESFESSVTFNLYAFCARAWSPRTSYFGFVRSTDDRGNVLIHTLRYTCHVKNTMMCATNYQNFGQRMEWQTIRETMSWFILCVQQIFSSNQMLANIHLSNASWWWFEVILWQFLPISCFSVH